MDTLSDPYLPEALKCFRDKKIWVGMEVGSDGKKRPINPFTGEFASCNDSNTWGTFIEAKNTLQGDISSRYAPQYVAIALSKDLGLVVIDLDGVRNPITREIEPWASEIVEKIDSYAEISQSGEGIHIYLLGAKTTTACRGQKIEVYDSGRFMMVTNNSLGEVSPLREASKELEEVCLKYLEKNRPHRMPIDHITTSSPMEDEEIIEKASNAKNGAKFKSLYFDGEIGAYGGDESRADQGLMSILVFWTQDKEQLERIFSKSTLGQRDKWNKRQDYRSRTIQAALDACLKVYESSQEKENIPLEEIIQAYHDNEEGDARLFIRLHGENYRFDPVEKAFYRWNGTYWGVDRKKNRFEDIRDVAQYYEKMDVEDKTLKQKLQARAYALKGNKRLKDVLEVSTQGEGGLTFIGEWDNIPYILPCVNGMIDLQTGKLTPSFWSVSIRNVCPTQYHPNAKCPLFEQFMRDIMIDDMEMVEFLQRLIGYMVLGMPVEHIFVIFWGENGRNGKGTFCRIFQKILGAFAKTFSPEMILLQRNPPSSGTPRADLVNLQGARLAIFSEINKKRALDPSQIKNLSGGDVISARALFSNDIRNFTPSHTLLIQTNYKPEAPPEDTALWRRAILVPFEAEFWPTPSQPHHKPIDIHLEEKLLKEASGILNWLVHGCLQYQKNGLAIPHKVQSAVANYREENNGIEIFLRDRCEKIPELATKCTAFRDSVRGFCTEEGYHVPTFPEITQYLIRQGYQKSHMNKGDYWRGIQIKQTEE